MFKWSQPYLLLNIFVSRRKKSIKNKIINLSLAAVAVLGTAAPGVENICEILVWQFLFIKIVFQILFRQNSNASKLCPVSISEALIPFLVSFFCLKSKYLLFDFSCVESLLPKKNAGTGAVAPCPTPSILKTTS